MAMDWAFGRDRPVAQLALQGACRSTIESWLSGEGLGFTTAATGPLGLPSAQSAFGGEPIVVHLQAEFLRSQPAQLIEALEALADRASVIAILDVELVDVLPPFFDVEGADYVAWPCRKELFMSVLQQIGPLSLKEPDAGPIAAEMLRVEVERISRALAALVEGAAPPAERQSPRSAPESARLIRGIIRRRRARGQFFPAELFADPAWDILLDLAAARLENTRVSISSLCIAAAVPTTTALRWIKGMTCAGILEREADLEDGRRSFVRLSDSAAAAMESFLTMVDDGVV